MYMVCCDTRRYYFKYIENAIAYFLKYWDALKSNGASDCVLIDGDGNAVCDYYDTVEEALQETWIVKMPDDYLWIELISFSDD